MSRTVKIAAGVFVFLVAAAIATPKLLSTDYVKQRIASQLSAITGRTVVLNGESEVSLQPYLSVLYNDVTIGDSQNSDGKPLVQMDALRAKLSILSAIWGDAKLSELHLVRPVFNLRIDNAGQVNWDITSGPLGNRIAMPSDQKPLPLSLGEVSIENGIVEFRDDLRDRTEKLTDVNGLLRWANVLSNATVETSAVWRGEIVNVSAELGSPFEILRGGASAASIQFTSKPLDMNFSGDLIISELTAKGAINGKAPSVKRASEWLKNYAPIADQLGELQLEGDVVVTPQKAEFSTLALTVSGHSGKGRMQISMGESGEPNLTGTLAFETLAFPAWEFSGGTNESDRKVARYDVISSLQGYSLDIRLSANSAKVSDYELTNIAAAAIVRDGKADLDIGQAEGLNGTVTGSLALQTQGDQAELAINLGMAAVDLDQLATVFGAPSFTLEGNGDLSLTLKSVGNNADALLRRLNGEVKLAAQDGVMKGIDLNDVFKTTEDKQNKVWQDTGGETPYDNFKLEFSIANGIAVVHDSEFNSDTIHVTLGGRSDLVARSLALRGKIKSNDNKEAVEAVPFFVGGTSSAPLFAPLFNRSVPKSDKKQAPPANGETNTQ